MTDPKTFWRTFSSFKRIEKYATMHLPGKVLSTA